MNIASRALPWLLAGTLSANAWAEGEEILQVKKSTFVNLVDLLVQRGVINQDEGKGLVSTAEQDARDIAQDQALGEAIDSADGRKKSPGNVKHVGYVPEFVKKEIREQVRSELKDEVISGVKADAKKEGWGVPGALPEWVKAINPTFDMRNRYANEFYGDDNQMFSGDPTENPYINWLSVNALGNSGEGGLDEHFRRNPNETRINNQIDRQRVRQRFRLGFEAQMADGLKTGVRFATSNIFNPVSNNQTLGNTGQSYMFAIDRGFVQYDFIDDQKTNWFSAYVGRFMNPFVSTDVVFDPDLSFEGVAGSFRLPFNRGSNKFHGYKTPNPTERFGLNQGQQSPDSVFLTAGLFPIQDIDMSAQDKWLYAGQVGADWLFEDHSRFNIAASYYQYDNVHARRNPIGSRDYDWTIPQFMQKGNTMVAITDVNSLNGCLDPTGCLFGLASEFNIFNATAFYDYAGFGPVHVLFTADYAKNLGFDRERILREFGNAYRSNDLRPRTTAYQARVDVGHRAMRHFGDWNVTMAYRYVQRDSVLDAFTDSLFHQGGTDTKGWLMSLQYALNRHAWLMMRWVSSDSIDGPRYSIDTLNVDLNTHF